jgi:drug/metabolite transporter (DMT)-like permease
VPVLLRSRRSGVGLAAAAGASLLGGAAVAATRVAVQSVDPLLLACLRYLIGGVCLLPFALRTPRFTIARRDRLPLLLLGAVFFGAFPVSFSAALRSTTAARGALALATVPVLTLLLSALRGNERVTPTKLLGIIMAFGGISLALVGDASGVGLHGVGAGDVLMFVAAACGALYNVGSQQYLRTYPPLAITAWSMLGGSGALLVAGAATGMLVGVPQMRPPVWLTVGFLGIVGTGMVSGLLAVALEAIAPTRVAIFITLNPLVAVGMSVGLLHEPVTERFVLGCAGVLAGIGLVNRNAGNR